MQFHLAKSPLNAFKTYASSIHHSSSSVKRNFGFFLSALGRSINLVQSIFSGSSSPSRSIFIGLSKNSSLSDSTNSSHLSVKYSKRYLSSFVLNSNETISSNYLFIRARSSEFNYSVNPSYISGSTGEILYSDFINAPRSYITTVGLYNDTNELLAVAKLSRPLPKDFTKEALVRVKLDF